MPSSFVAEQIIEPPATLLPLDVVIASYPRSGNTWLRLLLADLLLQLNEIPTATKLPTHEDELIPDLDRGDPAFVERDGIVLPCGFYKTHRCYQAGMHRTVWVIRQPTASLVSYFHFHRRYAELTQFAEQGIDLFCKQFAIDWCRHTQHHQSIVTTDPERTLMVTYEGLHANPIEELARIAQFLGIHADRSMCEIAIDNHSFAKQRATEKEAGENGEFFFRSGQVDSARNELTEEANEFIDASVGDVYRTAVNSVDDHDDLIESG